MKKLSSLLLVFLLALSQLTASFLPISAAVIALNNDYLRFGDGGDSINGTGLLNQPFYYHATYGWRQLTFSSYPLDYQIGVDGDGTNNWNLNGTISLNPTLSNLAIDTSYGYTSLVDGKGYGNLVTSGTVTIGGKTLRITQTYQLPEGKAFIKVTTKVENLTSGLADNKVSNLRFWLGTQDDYIGGSDSNTKTKGNLVDGAFQAISSPTTQAKALQISSGVESVLFFTDTDKANTIIGTRYGWYNVGNVNPVNSPKSYTSDGSYAFYVRFNDLEANQSDQFTWYYAAGEVSKIADIIKDVSDAATAVGNVTPDSATLTVSTPTTSTGYYIVVPRGSQTPSAQEIYAGDNYGSVTVYKKGSIELPANTSTELTIDGLAEGTQYDVYFVTRTVDGETVTFGSVTKTEVNTPLNPLISLSEITSIDIPKNHRVPDTAPIETDSYTATVTWNPNDAYFNDGVSYTATITITPKPGYTLTGLAANTLKVSGATVTHNANSGVLTAVYPAVALDNVIFHTQGGSAVASQPTDYDALVTLPTNPTYQGYSFMGWYTEAAYATAWDFENDRMPASNLNLYAKWAALDQTVTFHANGGVGNNTTQNAKTDSRTALDEQTFTRTGYTFSGWALSSTAVTPVYQSNETITWFNTNTDLFAVWSPNNQTVTFHANGGVGNNETQIAKTDSQTALKTTAFTRTGYSLVGWATSASGPLVYEPLQTIPWFNTNSDLYAVWSANDQTVTFIANGGVGANETQMAKTDSQTSLKTTAFTRTGYSLIGWATSASGPLVYEPQETITWFNTGTNLYAVWSADDQTVTFHANGGVGNNATQTAKTDSRTALDEQTFTRIGYTFSGWAITSSGAVVYEPQETITWFNTNTDLYAVWSPNNQTITFHANGGVGANETQMAKTDSQTSLKTTAFTRTGYSLIGWATSASGPLVYEPQETITWFNTNSDLYAVWSANDQTVTFIANGGVGNNETQFAKTDSQTALIKTAFTRTGYSLVGWATSFSGSVVYQPQETITWFNTATTLYAVWSADDQTVTFHANGGVGDNTTQTAKTDSRTALDEQTFTRIGYSFSGWATASSGDVVYEPQATIRWFNTDTDLYAVWSPENQTVTFHANGGVGANETQLAKTDSQTALIGPAFTRTGYSLVGWATSASGPLVYEPQETITWFNTNTDLYAVWSADDQTVTFIPNGGVGLSTTQTAKTDSETTLDPNPFSKVGYHFLGWSIDPEASEAEYAESETITWFNGAQTLYAIWGINYYDVTFDSQGGSSVPKQTLPYQGYVVKPSDPTRTGYRFTGWTEGSSAYEFDLPLTSALTLNAGWDILRYGIRYDYAGGSGNNPDSYTITDSFTLQSPVREGYRFLGWLEGNTLVTSIAPGRTGDISLTASWQFIPADPKLGQVQVSDVNEAGATFKTDFISLGNPKAIRFGYELTDLSTGRVFDFTSASDLALTLSVLQPYTAYEVRAYGFNGTKNVYSSPMSFTTLPLDTDQDGIPDQRDSAPQDPEQSYDPDTFDLTRSPVSTFTGVPESTGSETLVLKLEPKDLLGLKPEENLEIIMGSVRFTVPVAIADQWLKQSQDGSSSISLKVLPGLSDATLESKLKADFGKKPLAILDYQLLRVYSDGREEPIHQLDGRIQVGVSLKENFTDYDPETMGIYYYNSETGLIEAIESEYDPEGQRLVFFTDHFSYYVLSTKADSALTDPNLLWFVSGFALILFLFAFIKRRKKHAS